MASPRTDIGVLGLQGDFAAHAEILSRCGVQATLVKLPSALRGLRGLVIPGGESTVMNAALLVALPKGLVTTTS